MYCPFIRRSQYGNAGDCEGRYCAIWDDEHSQCAIKSFLIPNSKNKIASLESPPSVEEMKESFMEAIKFGMIKGDS